MGDRRSHRGPHGEDHRLFAPEAVPLLRLATGDLCWLLSRGYAPKSALKLVGDRYDLVARQRVAVGRCACSDAEIAARQERRLGPHDLQRQPLWLDGYNVLTTVEAALAAGVILLACDGTYRDMASMHGSYRKVEETRPALELLGKTLAALEVADCRWLLDRPVSNSGRLRKIMEAVAAAHGWPWEIELVQDPDGELCKCAAKPVGAAVELPPQHPVVVTADSAILDRCGRWFNLARETIDHHVSDAWVVALAE